VERLPNDLMPNFADREVSKEQAAEELYQALCKIAKANGHDPKWEVSIMKDHNKYEEINEGDIWVTYEAGPWEWGVGYSLGSHPKSYTWPTTKQDWYLETYYGFDVIFTDI
tara:strand:- start:64 stop:396 length:333 start_codon:yes stop_codon:yes gene_type:complete